MPTTKASYGEKKTHTTKDGKKAKKGYIGIFAEL